MDVLPKNLAKFSIETQTKIFPKELWLWPHKERKKERKCNNLMIARILKLTAAYNTECIRAQKMLFFVLSRSAKKKGPKFLFGMEGHN